MKNNTLFPSLVFVIILLACSIQPAWSQKQTIRGILTDKITQAPLQEASIIILDTSPLKGSITDSAGKFKIEDVSAGTYTIKISLLGYKELTISDVLVNSGKELVLNPAMDEDVHSMNEVVVSAHNEKNLPINDMALVSVRQFSVEEARKYAASVNDPLRMALAFPGVVTVGRDLNNMISIRGNSPNGLGYRIEGIEIPNPNHFSQVGTSGGGISILSSQLLTNSDFISGAFPAEYGNALSGIFDLRLRKGNNEKREHTVQIGLLGTDVATEGPFKKGYGGSYLINYRYSTLGLLSKMGINLSSGITTFQDLSYNISLPTKKLGNFGLFGFGGLSSQIDDSPPTYNYFAANTGAAGLTHTYTLKSSAVIRSVLLFSGTQNTVNDDFTNFSKVSVPQSAEKANQSKVSVSVSLRQKLSPRLNYKVGIIYENMGYNLSFSDRNNTTNTLVNTIQQDGRANLMRAYIQWSYMITEKLIFNPGLNFMYFALNKTQSLEPRAFLKYIFNAHNSLAFGYGLHSQIQPMGVYFFNAQNANGETYLPNYNLGFTKAHHFVLSYDKMLNESLHFKAETYFQYLYNVPVNTIVSPFYSILNQTSGYANLPLQNTGQGENYGLEFTFEQYMKKGLYFLITSSLYDSKFRAPGTDWYNVQFNSHIALNLTAGKDFQTGKGFGNRIIGVNLKVLYHGGQRTTPINVAASMASNDVVYYNQPYADKLPDYFRSDIRISVKKNRTKTTSTWALDIQNVTNHKNVLSYSVFGPTRQIVTNYQPLLVPILSYRLEF